MTTPVRLGPVQVGVGPPVLVVPLVATSIDDLAAQASAARDVGDVLEWRIDHMSDTSTDHVLDAGHALAEAAGTTPVLATYRTVAEGGADRRTGLREYTVRYQALLAAHLAAAIDVETALDVPDVIAAARDASTIIVGSSHDNAGTPPVEQIVARLAASAEHADICKAAVTAHTPDDVLALLTATREASRRLAQPVITMAMGPVGVITRLAGETFGSAAT
ncbi:MAG: type I 3-dehydroquinate dehydratase, partial [Micrococcales bacterium]|nr:type I 3-dehydroquinate dehydratase [Micrococcales bacterium]